MRLPARASAAALLLALAAPPAVLAAPPKKDPKAEALALALSVEESLVKSIAAVQECSVTVFQSRRAASGELGRAGGGSGVLFRGRGKWYVLTNEHVIQGAELIEVVTFDGLVHTMTLHDHVPQYDIAILAFERAPKRAKEAKFGKSEKLSEGQWVVATGNPFFLGADGRPVATLGVISGLERTIGGDYGGQFHYANAIQHDAEVNPGNSGGPLWNLEGELVGINGMIAMRGGGSSLGASNTGASYAIPIHVVQVYLRSLLDTRVEAAAGYTGFTVESATDEKGAPIGARVKKVAPDCPCRKQGNAPREPGIAPGDLLVKIRHGGKDHEIRTETDYDNAIATVPAGEKVTLFYVRDKRKGSWTGELTAASR
jgi:putative serine protease PepD